MSNNDKLSKEDLEYIAKLALLELREDEKRELVKQLSEILGYFKKLSELDTSNVKPMTHPIEDLKNVFREDIPSKSLTSKEALKNAKQTLKDFFKAPKVLKD